MNPRKGRRHNPFLLWSVFLCFLCIGGAVTVPAGDLRLAADPTKAQPLPQRLGIDTRKAGLAPSNVGGIALGPSTIKIVWTRHRGVGSQINIVAPPGYRVFRHPSGQPLSGLLGPDVVEFKDINATPSTEMSYTIWADYGEGSMYSPGKSAVVTIKTPPVYNPKNFQASHDAGGKITLTWDPIPGVFCYWLQGDGVAPQKVQDTKYIVPAQGPGIHTYTLIAYFGDRGQYADEKAPVKVTARYYAPSASSVPGPDYDPKLTTLIGRVTHAGIGVQGCAVTTKSVHETGWTSIATCYSGPDGRYSIPNLTPGKYGVTFTPPTGYLVIGGGSFSIDVQPPPPGSYVLGSTYEINAVLGPVMTIPKVPRR